MMTKRKLFLKTSKPKHQNKNAQNQKPATFSQADRERGEKKYRYCISVAASDVISCCHILGAQHMKGNTWLWPVGDHQCGAGSKSHKAVERPSLSFFGRSLVHLQFHILPAAAAAPVAASLQAVLKGHLNLSTSSLGQVGLLVCTILGLEAWCGEGEGAVCRVLIFVSSKRLGWFCCNHLRLGCT